MYERARKQATGSETTLMLHAIHLTTTEHNLAGIMIGNVFAWKKLGRRLIDLQVATEVEAWR